MLAQCRLRAVCVMWAGALCRSRGCGRVWVLPWTHSHLFECQASLEMLTVGACVCADAAARASGGE